LRVQKNDLNSENIRMLRIFQSGLGIAFIFRLNSPTA